MDDRNYLYHGRKTIKNEGRVESSIPTDKNSNTKEELPKRTGFAVSSFFTPKFYSQKGGDKEDLANRYANQINFSPEIVLFKNTDNSKYLLLVSPILSYREDFHLKRNVNRLLDAEILMAWKFDKGLYSLNLEGGRGYQRLDAYGIMFNGFANYGEMNFHWKPLAIKLSLLGLSYNYRQENVTMRANDTNDKLFGGNVVFESIPFIQHLQVFNYLILEPKQIAERNFYQEDKAFKPQARLNYRGFELKTKDFLNQINLELGLFSVKGYRDYAEYSNQTFHHISKTNGFLSYLAFNFSLKNLSFRTGGLYATKDRSNTLNREHNGYSSLLSDVRIFGGKSSFLLMETVNQRNGTLFREFDSKRENLYDTSGMELINVTLTYAFSQNFQLTGILNHVSSGLGVGNEGILSALYHFKSTQADNSGFLLVSVCVARVNPITQTKILYDEFRVDPAIKEFTRFYTSGGVYF